MARVKIVTHPAHLGVCQDDDLIDTALRLIAAGFGDQNEWAEKYGTSVENDVFMMHRYCWCEKPDCLWCCVWLSNEIECSEEQASAHRDKHERLVREKYGEWAAKHPGAPHFWYKPSGFQIRWYKYIGRDMEASTDSLPSEFLQKIFQTHPSGMTVEDAIAVLSERTDETQRRFREIIEAVNQH